MIRLTMRRAALALGLAAMTLAGTAWAQTPPTPFTCEGELYQLRASTGATSPTQIYKIDDPAAPAPVLAFTIPGISLNSLAYNPQDGFLYAVNNYTSAAGFRLYRLGANGAWSSAPITRDPTNLALFDQRNSGTFDAQGNYFVVDGRAGPGTPSGPQRLYVITGADGNAPVVRHVPVEGDDEAPSGYEASAHLFVADVAYSHAESDASTAVLYGVRRHESGTIYLYRVAVNMAGASPVGKVSRIAITDLPTTRTNPTGNITYGSAYIDQAGNLLVSGDTEGFYRIDRGTGEAVELAAPGNTVTSNTDGTTCRALPQIDVVKQAGAPVTQPNGHSFDVPYTLTVGNTFVVPAPNVQVSENLRNTFATNTPVLSIVSGPTVTPNPATASCTLNPGFDGTSNFALLSGTDTLAPGDSCTVSFTVRVAYANAAAVPADPQQNTAYASVTTTPNAGHTWPGGTLTPPADMVAQDRSTNAPTLPDEPNEDTPAPTPVSLQAATASFAKTIVDGANPVPGGVVEYGITLNNANAIDLVFPAGSITDDLPAHTTHAGGDHFTCAGTSCSNTNSVTVPANGGSVVLNFRVRVDAGTPVNTVIANTITPPAGNECATLTACSVTTTVVAPPPPPADMSVTISGLPSVISPGSTVHGTITCTADAGMGAALQATCTATAENSNGAAVGVTVGACTPPTPVASLPAGSSISCPISYTAPGTPGGEDTLPTSVTVTATTGASNDSNAANNDATSTAAIIDAVDDSVTDQPAGALGETYNVAGNDQVPAGSVFSLDPGGSTCGSAAISPAGLATFDVPASGGDSCTVAYKVCAPAPDDAVCDTAVLTVTASAGPRASNDTETLIIGAPTTVPVLDNDPDGGTAAPGTIELANPPAGATLSPDRKTLTVPGEGEWTVNGNDVVFTPEGGFTGVPRPIGYSFAAVGGGRSNVATITLMAAAGGGGGITAVPTLSQWGLMLLAALLGALGVRRRRGAH